MSDTRSTSPPQEAHLEEKLPRCGVLADLNQILEVSSRMLAHPSGSALPALWGVGGTLPCLCLPLPTRTTRRYRPMCSQIKHWSMRTCRDTRTHNSSLSPVPASPPLRIACCSDDLTVLAARAGQKPPDSPRLRVPRHTQQTPPDATALRTRTHMGPPPQTDLTRTVVGYRWLVRGATGSAAPGSTMTIFVYPGASSEPSCSSARAATEVRTSAPET